MQTLTDVTTVSPKGPYHAQSSGVLQETARKKKKKTKKIVAKEEMTN